MLKKPKGQFNNGQSRDTGNTGHKRHRTKTNKNKTKTKLSTTHVIKIMSNTDDKKLVLAKAKRNLLNGSSVC